MNSPRSPRKALPSNALAAALLASLLTGCALVEPRVDLVQQFDPTQTQALLLGGANSIAGSAVLLHPFGGAANCAGYAAVLLPATAYADERMGALYGPKRQGMAWPPGPRFLPDPPAYQAASRTVSCDAKGRFRFDNVADGSYYVVATVPWQVRPAYLALGLLPQPAQIVPISLSQRLSVAGGKPFSVELLGKP